MHAGYCSFVAQLSEAGEGDSGAGLSPAGLGETELSAVTVFTRADAHLSVGFLHL